MDGSGIDFVEADFGSEAAAGGGANLQNRSPAEWEKWSKRKYSTPLKPFFFMALCFIALISLPWLLDCIQDMMIAKNNAGSAENNATTESVAGQENAVDGEDSQLSTQEAVQNSVPLSVPQQGQQGYTSSFAPENNVQSLPQSYQSQYFQSQNYGQGQNAGAYNYPQNAPVRQKIVVSR